MELQAISLRPLVSSQAELAPYLAGLDVGEALQDFGRLADLVLSRDEHHQQAEQQQQQQQPQQQPQWPWQADAFADNQKQQHQPEAVSYGYGASSIYAFLQDSSSPGSPGGASLCSTATTTSASSGGALSHWSQVSSPMSSDQFYSSSSSCSSAYSSSAASSICGDLDLESSRQTTSGGRSRQRSHSHSRRAIEKHSGGGDRRRQNATAAERYRRKLKGRRCGLDEELERERERNARLMESFEAKLELYREFADLLAANTRDPSADLDLAQLGSRSLDTILEQVCPAQFLAANGRQRVELERLQEHFRRVLSIGQFHRQ